MDSFGFELAETARVMRRDFDRRASALGVTRAQWRVLLRLGGTADVRQVDLAEALDVEPITLCRMIDRLEDAGLVERRKNEIDRRAWNIHLTDKAKPLMQELQRLGDQFHEDVLAGVSRRDKQHALAVLGRIRSNISKGGTSATRKAS